eukprot:XP_001697804.1 predicted protein [Chlamydomonas reinhardtii]
MLCRHWEPAQLLAAEQDQLQQLEAVLRPLRFDTDVSNLLSRFLPGSRQWIFQAFADWLALGSNHRQAAAAAGGDAAGGSSGDLAQRAMVLYGGPGLGKSTIAAALVCKKVFRQEGGAAVAGTAGGAAAAAAGGADAAAAVEASAVVAHYFCKHTDVE